MRLLAAILSLYILVLTGIPCCLYDNCEAEYAIGNNGKEQQHRKEDKDACGACSPFSCTTCAGFVASECRYIAHPRIAIFKKEYNEYLLPFYREPIPLLWQPPDIA